jgi:TolB-like protein/Tfp pilus assembly protein PilF
MFRSLFAELKRRNVIRVAGVYVVVAWGILQVANNLFPALMLPAWTITFVAVLLLIGFPLTAIIAWAFEVTPDGIRRTPAALGAEPLRARNSWVEGLLLLGILVVVALSVTQLMRPAKVAEPPAVVSNDAAVAANSLAVLPFTSFSNDPDSNYFADGLTEELIHDVAQISGLKVSGRTSAFYFKDRSVDLREVGRQLGVAHVLEGSVRRSGNRLRITVQLISTADGFHLWSQTYDRLMNDIFEIQEDVAANVAATLEMKLVDTAHTRAMTHDMELYQQFLVATALLRDRGLAQLTQARALFQTAVEREPDNVEALAGYAQATMLLASAYLTLDFEPAAAAAVAAVEHARKLDPKSVSANVAAGIVYTTLLHRTDERRYRDLADEALSRAVELAPDDADALAAYGTLLNELGRSEEALGVMQRAVERDPLSRPAQFQLVTAYEGLGRLGEARAKLEELIARYPDWVAAKLEMGEMLAGQGRFVDALAWLQQAHDARTNPRASYALANLYLNLGLDDAVRATISATTYAPLTESIGQVILLNMQGDDAATLQLAQRELANTNDRLWRQLIISTALIVGDLATARAQLQQLEPKVLAPQPDVAEVQSDTALYAANLLAREGDAAGAGHILEHLLALHAAPAQGYDSTAAKLLRAKALAQLGRNDAAIAELRAAQLQGYRMLWDFDNFHRLDRLPWFERLRDDPKFRAVVDAIDADNRTSRAEVERVLNAAPGAASGAAATAPTATGARSAAGAPAVDVRAAGGPRAVDVRAAGDTPAADPQ